MKRLCSLKMLCSIFVVCVASATASNAQTFTTLASFNITNGAKPLWPPLQGTNGKFYGATLYGGTGTVCGISDGCGAVYKMTLTPAVKLSAIHSFCTQASCPDGAGSGGLIEAANGNLYGGTDGGGTYGYGTIFKITTGGALTTLHSFDFTDGSQPSGGVQASDGNVYGTTFKGGTVSSCDSPYGCGTIFKMTPAGTLTSLFSFDGTDGSGPLGGLIQATNGNFYGTTRVAKGEEGNESYGYGTVFEFTLPDTLTTLYNFCSQPNCTDGAYPYAGLIQASDGNFYGTTVNGGANDTSCSNGCGTLFEITPTGTLTTLHSFCSQADCADGAAPFRLVQGTDGNLYGTTVFGGNNSSCPITDGCGTIFKITLGGTLTTLHSFDGTDGDSPEGLVQGTDGNFYGTTAGGGADSSCPSDNVTEVPGCGTIFELNVGLGPFVETLSATGKVGAAVIILGSDLTGATAVSFNGTAATFTAKSSEITTKVPAGATTGTVTVTTASGTLSSNVAFRVTPQLKSFKPTKGPVGTQVTITGVSFTQTTGVSFDGVSATAFTVNSDTEVTVTVPTGATTGTITITTLGGTATSTKSFTVTE